MRAFGTAARAVGLVLTIPAAELAAQIDYRNLDHERPVATEDAYALERHAFEMLLPLGTERERDGEHLLLVPLGIEYGVFDNTQVGVGLPIGAVDAAGTDVEWGLAGLQVFGLYNFNTEGPVLPALSIGADVAFPLGSLAGEHTRLALKAIATRSWGLTRLHFNAVRSFGSGDQPGVEFAPRWSYSLALDRALFRRSVLLVAELLTQRSVSEEPVEVNAAFGVRYQLTPTFVLDAGAGRRLSADAGPDYRLTVGLSHAFGVPWLMPGGAR